MDQSRVSSTPSVVQSRPANKNVRFRKGSAACVSSLLFVLFALLITRVYARKSEAASGENDGSALVNNLGDNPVLLQYETQPTDESPTDEWPLHNSQPGPSRPETDEPDEDDQDNGDNRNNSNRDDDDDDQQAPAAPAPQESQPAASEQSLAVPPAPTETPEPSMLPALPATGDCILATKTNQGVNVRVEPSTASGLAGFLQVASRPQILSQAINENGEQWYQIEQGWVKASVVRVGGDCSALATDGENPQIVLIRDGHESTLDTVDITFSVEIDGNADIFTLVDGAITQLTDSADESDLLPVASPSGNWVAFISVGTEDNVSLRVVHAVNHSMLVVFAASEDYTIPLYPFTWSPDSRSLLVTLIDADGVPGIYRIDISSPMSIPEPELVIQAAAMPVYSSGGEYLAFQQVGIGTRHIGALIPTNGVTTILTEPLRRASCYAPSFGADAETLFFLCDEGTQTQLYRYDQGGLEIMRVDVPPQSTFVAARNGYLEFSDGTTLYLLPEAGGEAFPILRSNQELVTMSEIMAG